MYLSYPSSTSHPPLFNPTSICPSPPAGAPPQPPIGGISAHGPPVLLGHISHHGFCYIIIAVGTHR